MSRRSDPRWSRALPSVAWTACLVLVLLAGSTAPPCRPPRVWGPPAQVLSFAGAAGGAPDPRTWHHDTGGGGWGNEELETYTDSTSNASLDGAGHLAITVRREQRTGADRITRQFTSARLTTDGTVLVPPGSYVEAPIEAPTGVGVWPAFWMLGADLSAVGWPACGEVDVFEGQGASPTRAYRAVHAASTSSSRTDVKVGWAQAGGTFDLGEPVDARPHRYGAYFDQDLVRLYVDRRPVMTVRAPDAAARGMTWPFGQSQELVLDVAVGLGDPASTAFPRTMRVGAISVWHGGVPF